MSEQFVKVTHNSWLDNIVNSVIGVVLGVALFFGSFFVLWFNEGRTDFAVVARGSQVVSPDRVDASAEGKLVSITGPLTAQEPVGDNPYLKPGAYVAVNRSVEMYSWDEESSSKTTKEVGGGSRTETTYTYSKKWSSSPEDSSHFEYPANHANPPMAVKSASSRADGGRAGAYPVDLASIDLPDGDALPLSSSIVNLGTRERLAAGYIYIGAGTPDSPQVGDLRISYKVVPSGAMMTTFGLLQGGRVQAFMYKGDTRFFRALPGDRATAIEALHTEYVVMGWLIRLGGFLMMWFGMMLSFGPVTAFLDFIPFIGNATGCAFGFISLGIALVLTSVTVIIAIIAHNILLLALVALLICAGLYVWRQSARKPALAT